MSDIRDMRDAAIDQRLANTYAALTTPGGSTPRAPTGRAAAALRNRKSKPDNTTPAAAAIKAYMHPTTPEEDI